MRATKQHLKKALDLLGVRYAFDQMNRNAQSFIELQESFKAFRVHVKNQYLVRAKTLHPDKQNGDVEKMKVLNAAYDLFKKLRLEPPLIIPQQTTTIHIIKPNHGCTVTSTFTSSTSSCWPGTGGF